MLAAATAALLRDRRRSLSVARAKARASMRKLSDRIEPTNLQPSFRPIFGTLRKNPSGFYIILASRGLNGDLASNDRMLASSKRRISVEGTSKLIRRSLDANIRSFEFDLQPS